MSEPTRERGQLILLGGLTLAVLLVALALVLNTAIYSENLASRGDAIGSDDALQLRDETETAVSGLIAAVNADSTQGECELRTAIAAWSETTALQNVRNGAETSVVPTSSPPVTCDGSTVPSIDLRLTYQTEQVYYETTVTVTP